MRRTLSNLVPALRDIAMIVVAFVLSVMFAIFMVGAFTLSVLVVTVAAAAHGAWETGLERLRRRRR